MYVLALRSCARERSRHARRVSNRPVRALTSPEWSFYRAGCPVGGAWFLRRSGKSRLADARTGPVAELKRDPG